MAKPIYENYAVCNLTCGRFLCGQMPVNSFAKTRFAPTPSGFLHLGNVLSFAITASLARERGAKILLRIDDLDQARVNKQYISDIFDTLNFLELPWDEGPRNAKEFGESFSQMHRLGTYNTTLQQLADDRKVFACTCSRSQLQDAPCDCVNKKIPLTTENASWRLITDMAAVLRIKNCSGETIRAALPADMDNFIVRKKDGFPAYQLTSVIDDLFFGVGLVVRGNDLWPSTLAQHALASALRKNDFADIAFCHHQLLTESSGKKLSKSAGATSVKYLRENSKSAGEIYQLIASMAGVTESVQNWQELANSCNFKKFQF
jgi:glutamyl/glutaminyl-tRNA synthetase